MGKDPAFLFYSKDFYEGTRMMLPEERACYIDLLIYQHQHRSDIPNDLRRLQMYCSGCSIDTIQNVLDHKFKQTPNGWLNQKLDHLVDERSKHKPKKIASATFAGLISSCNLNQRQKNKIKKSFRISDFIQNNDQIITDETLIKSMVREWFTNLVDHMVNNLGNGIANGNVIKNENKGKGGAGEKPNGHNGPIPIDLDELESQVKNEISWKETICRNAKEVDIGFSMSKVEDYLDQFFKTLANDGETDKTLKDFKKHFSRWLNIQLEKSKKNEKSGNITDYAKRANDAVDRFFGQAR